MSQARGKTLAGRRTAGRAALRKDRPVIPGERKKGTPQLLRARASTCAVDVRTPGTKATFAVDGFAARWADIHAEHQQVAGDAECDLGEHRVRIRVPEREPCSQWLSNINHQDGNGAAVTDEADNHGGVQDGSEIGTLQKV